MASLVSQSLLAAQQAVAADIQQLAPIDSWYRSGGGAVPQCWLSALLGAAEPRIRWAARGARADGLGTRMKHYFNPMSRAVTSDWMLKELEAEHERIVIDIQAGEQDSPEYRAINPMGKVPTLVDGDAVVTEAGAICAYLADKFAEKGFAPTPGSQERGSYYRYLFFPGTTLEPLLSVTSLGIEEIKPHTMGWGDMPRAMAAVESMTPGAGWALGEQFTAADVVFGGTLAFFCGFKMMTPSPRVESYVERIKSRRAYQESHVGF